MSYGGSGFPAFVRLVIAIGLSVAAGQFGAAIAQTSSRSEGSYPIEGVGLGDLVTQKQVYSTLKCSPSEVFQTSSWCIRSRQDKGPHGSFTNTIALLQSNDDKAWYVARVIEPAFFAPDDVDGEIERLSRIYHQQAKILAMPQKAGLPSGLIARWGDVTLTPLDAESVQVLASGGNPKKGFYVDFLGNFKRSAQEGLPIYVLSGGAGMIWNASYDENGKGNLRISAIDASKLALISGPPVAEQVSPAFSSVIVHASPMLPSPQTVRAQERPCEQIRIACQAAAFVRGGAGAGNGLALDCVAPIVQGRPQPGAISRPLPQIDATVVAACRTARTGSGVPTRLAVPPTQSLLATQAAPPTQGLPATQAGQEAEHLADEAARQADAEPQKQEVEQKAIAAPCQQIRTICQAAGFLEGGVGSGNGLAVDCVRPFILGKPQRAAARIRLPPIDPTVVDACKRTSDGYAIEVEAQRQAVAENELTKQEAEAKATVEAERHADEAAKQAEVERQVATEKEEEESNATEKAGEEADDTSGAAAAVDRPNDNVQAIAPFEVSKQEIRQQIGVHRSYTTDMVLQEVTPQYYSGIRLSITSTVDDLTINLVSVNRGNCSIIFTPYFLTKSLPVTLKFGEAWQPFVSCDPIEVKVDTTQGSWTTTWSP